MNYREKITLHLRARHFEGAAYLFGDTGGAMETSMKELYPESNPVEGVDQIIVYNPRTIYGHDAYTYRDFDRDARAAALATDKDQVINTLTLIKQ